MTRYYVHPTEAGSESLANARVTFFELLEEEAPEVRQELRDRVQPQYRLMLESFRTRGLEPPVPHDFRELYTSDAFTEWFTASREVPELQEFANTLDALIERFNLSTPWLRDAAIRTIQAWGINPSLTESNCWFLKMPRIPTALTIEEMEFKLALTWVWDTTSLTRAYARTRAIKDFEAALDQWLDEREQLARDRGFVPAPDIRQADKHTRWLVRYQVLGESFTSIARDERMRAPEAQGRQTVAAGVRAVATRIGIQLRQTDPGGPPQRRKQPSKRKHAK